ncbi:MAG: hypothetical protein WCI21_04945, partial [Alphaproteobacteria bacterium]
FAAVLTGAAPMALAQPRDVTEVTQLESIAVALGEAPLPKVGAGAPNLSPEQTASFICRNQDAGLFRIFTGPVYQRAHDATVHARQVRIAAFQGQATEKEIIEAELNRQSAVNTASMGLGKIDKAPAPPRNGLSLEAMGVQRVNENGRWVLKVTGVVRNLTDARKELPAVSMRAVDVNDFMVSGQTSLLDQVDIGPHESLDFVLRYHNPPEYAVRVSPVFAPPFYQRNFRGCDFFNPVDFDPNESAVRRSVSRRNDPPPVPVPAVGEGAPRYTPAQIAFLARQARSDAVTAYGVTPRSLCADMPGRRRWRDLLVLADRLDEAWIATNAAEEIRRDAARNVFYPEEVASAEVDRQKAVRAFMAARPVNPPPGPPQYGLLSIVESSVSGRSDTTQVAGEIRNNGADKVPMPPLKITAIDPYGYVVSEQVRDPDEMIAGRSSHSFSIRLNVPAELVARVKVEFAC